MSGAYTVPGLLFALEAVGVVLELNAAGDGLKVAGTGRPPADLLAAVKALKPDLLTHLKGVQVGAFETEKPPAKAEAFSRFETGKIDRLEGGQHLPPLTSSPDWATIAAQPGHCGSCARSKPAPEEWGPGMVVCTCDSVAWWPMNPPFAIHFAARCGAFQLPGEEVGGGWRAKAGGKRWGALPAFETEEKTSDQGAA